MHEFDVLTLYLSTTVHLHLINNNVIADVVIIVIVKRVLRFDMALTAAARVVLIS